MDPTAEVRWFRRGPLPDRVETWFRSREPRPDREAARVDRYLRPAPHGGLNVKLRAGRLEIKRRTAAEGERQFVGGAAGLVERWRKWSFPVRADAETDLLDAATSADWIAVRKERLLKEYYFQSGSQISEGPSVEGCEAELTRIEVSGNAWWTLAFEAFGEETTLLENLIVAAEEALRAPCPTPLRSGDSRGYASWLARLRREEGV